MTTWLRYSLGALIIGLIFVALILASNAVNRNREQDRQQALERVEEAQREAERLRQKAIDDCHQLNLTRRTTFESNYALIIFALSNRPDPGADIPPVVQQFLDHNFQANDPVNCEYGTPNFGVDATPPAPLPVIADIPGNPYESFG